VGPDVGEVALLRFRRQDSGRRNRVGRARSRAWLRDVFIVKEEEQLLFEARNERQQRAADGADRGVPAHFGALYALQVVVDRIRVEGFVAKLMQYLSVILLGPALGYQTNLHRAFAARLRAQPRRRNGHLLDGVNARRGEGEEARAAALEALRI